MWRVERTTVALTVMLSAHASFLAWSAYRNSPVFHEAPHLPAGISHLLFGRFELYRVNPPLPRMIAAVPVLLLDPATAWEHYRTYPTLRSEFRVGADFIKANGGRSLWLYTVARWACIPFSILGAVACYLWAKRLYGVCSGLTAALLWCCSPFILGHAALVMPDVPSAAFAVIAAYSFWLWLLRPSWLGSLSTGALWGLGLLAKTTLVILVVVWPVTWCISRAFSRDNRQLAPEMGMLAVTMLIATFVLNVGYLFDGSFKSLGTYNFVSESLAGKNGLNPLLHNAFAGKWIGYIPVPLPEQFVLGIDQQKADFERQNPCYLRGRTNSPLK